MKRSEVNAAIDLAKQVFDAIGCKLPPFAFWTTEEWHNKGSECDEIRQCMLGWDVTDFGHNRFDELGRTLFTLRNGGPGTAYKKDYAEKLILDPEDQKPPLHFHRNKMEDIVNRGGGNILIRLFNTTVDNRCADTDLTVQVDGTARKIQAGAIIRLEPGQSICITPRTIHQFWGERGTGIRIGNKRCTVSGEVSRVCDDHNDNYWLEPCERYCQIEEDEPSRQYLVHEYPAAR
jgi:hypothetical protein